MGFYRDITDTYGSNTTVLMKKWSSLNIKLANCTNRRNFLLRCRRNEIIPKHVHDSIRTMEKRISTNNWKISEEMKRHLKQLRKKNLNLEIKVCYQDLRGINSCIHKIKLELAKYVPEFIFQEYSRRLKISYDKKFVKIKNLNLEKFDSLYRKQKGDDRLFIDNSKWFMNVSDVDIPKEVSEFLSLGPKFGVSPTVRDFETKNFLADVECIVSDIPDDNKNNIRAKITNNVTNFLNQIKTKPLTNLQQSFKNTKKFLEENKELYILKADKGGCTVAMSRRDYIEKTETMLGDDSTYKILEVDPTAKLQRLLNETLKRLKNSKDISVEVGKHLTTYNSVISKLYCLPKIHKPNVPLRPIVSCVGSTTYNLAKFLANILTVSLADRTDFNVQDTFSFVNNVNGIGLPQNYVLVSFDVVSLFTNIPYTFTVDIIETYWHKIEQNTTIKKSNFLGLLSLICNHCYFSFNNKFYKQVFGTPMGSPISPILAQIVMDFLLEKIIAKLPFQLPFLFKFVDDIITSVPAHQINTSLEIFNSLNQNIQFTMEEENNNSVPFLDTLLIRSNNKIILDWYQKPTASGRFLNYFSNHPTNQKYNTIIAMKNRIVHISDETFLHKNLNRLFQLFLNNGYPRTTLKKLIFNSNFYDGPTEDNVPIQVTYKKLSYAHGLTDNVIKHLKPFNSIKIAKYNSVTIKRVFSKIKDETPKFDNTNVIYKIPCQDCDACYIGQTTQTLKQRIVQHKSDSRLGKKSCALATHFQEFNHKFNFENTAILEREANYRKRLFLEMVHINCDRRSINSRSDIDQLSVIYCDLLK